MNLEKLAKEQERLAANLSLEWDGREVELVGGADFAYDRKRDLIGACLVLLRFPGLEPEEVFFKKKEINFPYLPGFLSFREGPVFVELFRGVKRKPDVLLIDGNGIAHPRRMGLASYLGVVLDMATIGCAKSAFYPFESPGERRGAYTYFRNEKGEKVGVCLRTRGGVKPVFISPGHKIDFEKSRYLALRLSKFRVPEPIRLAHSFSREMFKEKP
ncbi:MAG: endonuclease V [Candidatus Aminicenantales bacterium]